jgi:cysteine desulfurase/selenocysteine lyase
VSRSLAEIRADFPGLKTREGGVWHYLDSGATAQKPQAVIDAMARAMGRITPPSIAASMPAAPR